MSGDQRGKVGQVNPLSLPGPGVQEETLILGHTVQHTSSCPRVRAGLQPPRLPTAGRTLGGSDGHIPWPHTLKWLNMVNFILKQTQHLGEKPAHYLVQNLHQYTMGSVCGCPFLHALSTFIVITWEKKPCPPLIHLPFLYSFPEHL